MSRRLPGFLKALSASLLLFTTGSQAAEVEYPRSISKWLEASVPLRHKRNVGDAYHCSIAAGNLGYEWRVFSKNGQPHVELISSKTEQVAGADTGTALLKFTPTAGKFFRESYSFAKVDDGWLVGFNEGEFGAALYWFSGDGKNNYKISDHHVVDFFMLPDGIHAIEGLAHMGVSFGSIIRVERVEAGGRWKAVFLTNLPLLYPDYYDAPYCVSVRKDDTALLTLGNSLVSFYADRKILALLSDAPWSGLHPNSSVLAQDETKLYIGMRQFVVEVDLITKKFRLLTPSKQFLNKFINLLPAETAERIRKQNGG